MTAAKAKRQFEEFCAELKLPVDVASLPIITYEDLHLLGSRIYQPQVLRPILNVRVVAVPTTD